MKKYIFITGGVVSGIGKGITAASLGMLLKARGLKVCAQKLDPYMNVDPGTMNPYQHGEVFVTDDGAETDLDLGHYERFIDENLNKYSNLTSGKVFWNVLNKERKGDYLGETVQVIPHITNEIKRYIYNNANKTNADIVITEIGGTIGDIESLPFLESIRQVCFEVGRENCLYIHVTLVPYLSSSQEHKSKPTQHSVKQLQQLGINPDIIVARSDRSIDEKVKEKISLFCNVKSDCVIENINLSSLYEAPIMLYDNKLDKIVCRELKLETKEPNLEKWLKMLENMKAIDQEVVIGMVGKYVKLPDAYISIVEALKHAGAKNKVKVTIKWIDSEFINEENVADQLANLDGILVPGGFGNRGIEGMILAARYARENNVPYFGICLGMQIAVIEFARNVLKLKGANSKEFDSETEYPVIDLMPSQIGVIDKGNSMRLGSYPCHIKENTIMARAYQEKLIHERHRHRYEFNSDYRQVMEDAGLLISGTSFEEQIVETIENPNCDFFVAVQFHPEFKSRPETSHPLFYEFVKACLSK